MLAPVQVLLQHKYPAINLECRFLPAPTPRALEARLRYSLARQPQFSHRPVQHVPQAAQRSMLRCHRDPLRRCSEVSRPARTLRHAPSLTRYECSRRVVAFHPARYPAARNSPLRCPNPMRPAVRHLARPIYPAQFATDCGRHRADRRTRSSLIGAAQFHCQLADSALATFL